MHVTVAGKVVVLPKLLADGSAIELSMQFADSTHQKDGLDLTITDKIDDKLGSASLPMRQYHQPPKTEVLFREAPVGNPISDVAGHRL